uniref:Uncharacterized protein n=1 Tax=Ditylenchus dipsaci TaxID=166011 RepID=A0A915DSP3_9BILA
MREHSNFLLFSCSSLNCSKSVIVGSAQSSTRRNRQNVYTNLRSSPVIMLLLLLPLLVSGGQDMEQPSTIPSLRTQPKEGFLAEDSSPVPNLFKEYLTRGMYTCTSRYVHTIAKLHALIKDAYEEYASCQKLMKDTSKSFTPTQFELLDELLEEWQDEQDVSTTPSPAEENTQSSNSLSHLTQVDSLPASAAPSTMEDNNREDQTHATKAEKRKEANQTFIYQADEKIRRGGWALLFVWIMWIIWMTKDYWLPPLCATRHKRRPRRTAIPVLVAHFSPSITSS